MPVSNIAWRMCVKFLQKLVISSDLCISYCGKIHIVAKCFGGLKNDSNHKNRFYSFCSSVIFLSLFCCWFTEKLTVTEEWSGSISFLPSPFLSVSLSPFLPFPSLFLSIVLLMPSSLWSVWFRLIEISLYLKAVDVHLYAFAFWYRSLSGRFLCSMFRFRGRGYFLQQVQHSCSHKGTYTNMRTQMDCQKVFYALKRVCVCLEQDDVW